MRFRGNLAIIYVICLAAISLALFAMQHPLLPGDLTVARAVQSIHNPAFAALMSAASMPGEAMPSLILIGIVAICCLLLTRPLDGVFVIATGIGQLIAWWVKLLVSRPRPGGDMVTVAHFFEGGSFPSGHVVHYTVFYGFLIYLSRSMRPSLARNVLRILLAVPIVIIGPSRIYLGAHWPSDVIGAYIIGGLILTALVHGHCRLREVMPERFR